MSDATTAKPKTGRPPARDLIIAEAERIGLELAVFDDRAVARFVVENDGIPKHREAAYVESGAFSRWLRVIAYRADIPPTGQSIPDARAILEARAFAEGERLAVHMRSYRAGDIITIDPGRPDWKLWTVDADGAKPLDSFAETAPWFVRVPGFGQLPDPVAGGTLDSLWRFANIPTDDRLFVLAWLVQTFREGLPCAALVLEGEQGSAKTSTARVLRRFTDPSVADVAAMPKNPEDLFILAAANRVLVLDNLSRLDEITADTLCIIGTGGARQVRKLYTDADVSITKALNPLILTGISEFVTRGDLADRSLIINLQNLAAHSRKTEERMTAELEGEAPGIMGALINLLRDALRLLPTVRQEDRERGRMADFDDLGEAVARALGYPAGTFDALAAHNRHETTALVLEGSPIVALLRRYIAERGAIDTTPSSLLGDLAAFVGESETRAPWWPRSVRQLTGTITRFAPALREQGYAVGIGRDNSRRFVKIWPSTRTGSPEAAGDVVPF
jgi:hypothetical protein